MLHEKEKDCAAVLFFFRDINPLRGFAIYASRAIFACGKRYACGRDRGSPKRACRVLGVPVGGFISYRIRRKPDISLFASANNIASRVVEIFRLFFRESKTDINLFRTRLKEEKPLLRLFSWSVGLEGPR